MPRRSNTSGEKAGIRYMLLFLLQKYDIRCYFCGLPFTELDVPARGYHLLTEHHKDHNRLNWRWENRVLVHRECHKRHHVTDNILKGV